MDANIAENAGCLLVAEYVDEGGEPTGSPVAIGQLVPTRPVADYVDTGNASGGFRDFTILLKNDCVVSVCGHGLRLFPSAVPGTGGSYGVIEHTGGKEVLVALFGVPEVVGIFSGEIRADRKTA